MILSVIQSVSEVIGVVYETAFVEQASTRSKSGDYACEPVCDKDEED